MKIFPQRGLLYPQLNILLLRTTLWPKLLLDHHLPWGSFQQQGIRRKVFCWEFQNKTPELSNQDGSYILDLNRFWVKKSLHNHFQSVGINGQTVKSWSPVGRKVTLNHSFAKCFRWNWKYAIENECFTWPDTVLNWNWICNSKWFFGPKQTHSLNDLLNKLGRVKLKINKIYSSTLE